ncbi:MAG: hypothetical protein HY911_01225 [Desulfobacterales bacterium]|nr:hypothetical protein [Desulfobacterales bacterium]
MRTLSLQLHALVLLLTACASATVHSQPDEMSPEFMVPVGSTLVLNQPLQMPAWQDQVYFQDGQTMSWGGVNIYMPHCTLKLTAKKETPQTIQADTFVVKKSYTELFFMQVQAPPQPGGIQLAAAAWGAAAPIDFETNEAMDYKVMAAVMELHSEAQPEAICMICADWGLPPERAHITLNKIRRALGAVMTLELARPPGAQL